MKANAVGDDGRLCDFEERRRDTAVRIDFADARQGDPAPRSHDKIKKLARRRN